MVENEKKKKIGKMILRQLNLVEFKSFLKVKFKSFSKTTIQMIMVLMVFNDLSESTIFNFKIYFYQFVIFYELF